MNSGMLLIHMYVPPAMIPQGFPDCRMQDFYRLVALAIRCRRMRQDDIQTAVARAFSDKED